MQTLIQYSCGKGVQTELAPHGLMPPHTLSPPLSCEDVEMLEHFPFLHVCASTLIT